MCLGLAAVACYLTATRLGYQTSRLDLLNPKSNYNRLWIEYIKEFGDEDDAVVVVEGASREQVVPVLEELSTALAREDRLFHAVLHEVDLGKIRSKGLHYLSPDELLGIDRFLTELGPILGGDWSPLNLGNMAGGMCAAAGAGRHGRRRAAAAEARDKLQRLANSLGESLGQRRRYQSPWPEMPSSFAILSELNSEYLLTKQGQLGFVLLRLARGEDGFTHCTEATDALRELIAQTQARHPDTKIGLTGLPIMENDEMRSSQTSMFWASLVSMVGVGLLFVAGFGGVRHALLANLGAAGRHGLGLRLRDAGGRPFEHPERHVHGDADRHRHRLRRVLRRPLPAIARREPRLRGRRCWKRRAAPARRSRPARSPRRSRSSPPASPASRASPSWASSPAAACCCAPWPSWSCCRPASTWSIAAAGACACPSRWPCTRWIAPFLQVAAADAGRRRWRFTVVAVGRA